jgi:hypothetical protein
LSSAEIPVAASYFMGHVMRVEFRKFIELQTGNPVCRQTPLWSAASGQPIPAVTR